MIDLHYHLYGSIFVFDLNWLSLMNDVAERKECFQQIQQYLNPSHVISVNERNVSLYHRVIKAAAIRLLLFWYIDGSLTDRMMESLYGSTINLLASNEDVWMESGRQPLQQRIQVARTEKAMNIRTVINDKQYWIMPYQMVLWSTLLRIKNIYIRSYREKGILCIACFGRYMEVNVIA